jgi:cell division transport system ATP-binding protein
MIEFSHVYKTYQATTHALKNVSFQVEKGEFVFISGPSGAGKTTLFRMMSAFDKPSSGTVIVNGRNLSSVNRGEIAYFRRHIGVVFQDFKILKDRTVFQNVALPLTLFDDRPQSIRSSAMKMLELVGLRFKEDHFPEQLSGGEQQRVAIARALIHKPGVLIADEPTGNLDSELSLEILKLFDTVNDQGTTVFIATHDKALIESTKRRCLKIKSGEIF